MNWTRGVASSLKLGEHIRINCCGEIERVSLYDGGLRQTTTALTGGSPGSGSGDGTWGFAPEADDVF